MRSVLNIDVSTGIEPAPRAIAIAMADRAEQPCSLRARAMLVLGSSAALWAAIGLLIHHIL